MQQHRLQTGLLQRHTVRRTGCYSEHLTAGAEQPGQSCLTPNHYSGHFIGFQSWIESRTRWRHWRSRGCHHWW